MVDGAPPRKKKRRTSAAAKPSSAAEPSSAAAQPSSAAAQPSASSVSDLFQTASNPSGSGSVSDLLKNAFADDVPASSSSSGATDGADLASTFTGLFNHGIAESKKREAEKAAEKQQVNAAEDAERIARALHGKRNKRVQAEEPKDSKPSILISPAELVKDPDAGERRAIDLEKQKPKKNPILTKEEKAEQETRTLFVGNVPLDWNEKNLKAALYAAAGDKYKGKMGPIWFRCQPVKEKWANPWLRKVGCIKMDYKQNGADDKCGFVVLDSVEGMNAVRLAAHGVKADSTHILRCDGIKGGSKMLNFDRKRSIFVGNLPGNTNEVDLRKCFEEVGEVSACRVIRDPNTHRCKGIAFVLFKERSSVKGALELWGTTIKSREIRVTRLEFPDEAATKEAAAAAQWSRNLQNSSKMWGAWRIDAKMRSLRRNVAQREKKRKDMAIKRGAPGAGKLAAKQRKRKPEGEKKVKLPKKAGGAIRDHAAQMGKKYK